MNCRKVRGVLPEYIGAELSATKRGQVEGHLKGCPGCRAALGQLQEVWDGLVEGPLPQKDEQFWENFTRGVMQEIRRKQPTPADKKLPFSLPGWRVLVPVTAAAIAVIVGLIVLKGGLQGPADRGLWIAPNEQEALVETAANLSVAPLATEEEDPLGGEMTLQEASLVADALGVSLQSAEITDVLSQLYNNEEDLYGQLEGLTAEELETFYQLLSSQYPYS